MIASLVYLMCAVTSVLCASALLYKFRRTSVPLLFWSGVCFVGFALSNVLLFVDLVLLPTAVSLLFFRTLPTLIGLGCLIWGLLWESA
jgi:hypothetical protein